MWIACGKDVQILMNQRRQMPPPRHYHKDYTPLTDRIAALSPLLDFLGDSFRSDGSR